MKKAPGFLLHGWVKLYLWAADLLYHSFAWTYDFVAALVSLGYWSEWRSAALFYVLHGQILEVGFGTGELLIEMVQRGYHCVGLELSGQMHRVANRKIIRLGIKAKRVRGRAQSLPFPDRVFTNVIATFPSNYIASEETLGEIHRVLGSAGRLVIVGLGVRYKSKIKQWLTGWFTGDWQGEMINFLAQKAEKKGFTARVIQHQTPAYILPVLVLERNSD